MTEEKTLDEKVMLCKPVPWLHYFDSSDDKLPSQDTLSHNRQDHIAFNSVYGSCELRKKVSEGYHPR